MSFDTKAYMKQYRYKLYHRRKDAGVCTLCGKFPARPSKVICEYCAQRESERLKSKRINQTKNFKKLIKAVKTSPFEFATAMNKDCEGGCIMDMFGCSERCEKYQELTCDDCIRDWLSEDDAEIKAFVCTVEDYHGNKKDCRVFANTATQAREKLIQEFPKYYVSPAVTLKEYMIKNRQEGDNDE